jgi:hypothetical protein
VSIVAPQIEIVNQSIEKDRRGTITGRICVKFDNYCFPEKDWNDAVVVILGWWLSEMAGLLAGRRMAELCFMDGPFQMRVEVTSAVKCFIHCMEGNGLGISHETNTLDLLQAILTAATLTYSVCDARGWQTKDLEQLRDRMEEVRLAGN